jgi:hypothetical protein
MADRVRAVWHERLIVLATDLPVDLDVDLLVTWGELSRVAREAAAARRALAARGWWLRARPPRPCAAPPAGGILRERLRRHGLVPGWVDLPALVPELVPTAAVAGTVKDAELAALTALKAEHEHAPYRVAGRRGRPGVLVWDPTRIADPAATLSRLLAAGVTLVGRDPPPSATTGRDIMDPRSWMFPAADEPPAPELIALAPSAPALSPGIILDTGEPPAFGFRGQGPPSVLTVTSILAIGRRVMVEVRMPSPSAPPAVVELAA